MTQKGGEQKNKKDKQNAWRLRQRESGRKVNKRERKSGRDEGETVNACFLAASAASTSVCGGVRADPHVFAQVA